MGPAWLDQSMLNAMVPILLFEKVVSTELTLNTLDEAIGKGFNIALWCTIHERRSLPLSVLRSESSVSFDVYKNNLDIIMLT